MENTQLVPFSGNSARTVVYAWTIHHFSRLLDATPQLGLLESPSFPGDEQFKFALEFFPNKLTNHSSGHLALVLKNKSPKSVPLVKFAISLLDCERNQWNMICSKYVNHLDFNEDGFPVPHFISHTQLLKCANRLLPQDKLTFLILIYIYNFDEIINAPNENHQFEIPRQTADPSTLVNCQIADFFSVLSTFQNSHFGTHQLAQLSLKSPNQLKFTIKLNLTKNQQDQIVLSIVIKSLDNSTVFDLSSATFKFTFPLLDGGAYSLQSSYEFSSIASAVVLCSEFPFQYLLSMMERVHQTDLIVIIELLQVKQSQQVINLKNLACNSSILAIGSGGFGAGNIAMSNVKTVIDKIENIYNHFISKWNVWKRIFAVIIFFVMCYYVNVYLSKPVDYLQNENAFFGQQLILDSQRETIDKLASKIDKLLEENAQMRDLLLQNLGRFQISNADQLSCDQEECSNLMIEGPAEQTPENKP